MFHKGNSLIDQLRHMVKDAAKNTRRDDAPVSQSLHVDASHHAREFPYTEQLQFVVGLLDLLGFTRENIFSKIKCAVDEKYALDAFEYYHTFVDRFPDTTDHKRTNNGLSTVADTIDRHLIEHKHLSLDMF